MSYYTYADVARLAPTLTPDTAEQWCDARGVNAEEAYVIWRAATLSDAVYMEMAERIWADETWWRGGLGHLVLVDDPHVGGWTVPATELVAALKRLGWTIDRQQGLAWEPETTTHDGGAYGALCDATTPVHQRDTTSDEAWDAIFETAGGCMRWRPDIGHKAWSLWLPDEA